MAHGQITAIGYLEPLEKEIEQLQARIAELEAEIDNLVSAIDEHMVVSHIGVFNRGDDPKIALNKIACYEQGLGDYFGEELKEQLAASQLREKQLREALQTFIDEHEECTDADDWMAMLCSIEAHHVAEEALSIPRDTSALDAYVAKRLHDMACDKGLLRIQVEELTRQRDLAVEALENCRLLAARHRKEEWAGHIMRFCKDAGLSGSPIRNDSIKESEAMAQVCEGGVR